MLKWLNKKNYFSFKTIAPIVIQGFNSIVGLCFAIFVPYFYSAEAEKYFYLMSLVSLQLVFSTPIVNRIIKESQDTNNIQIFLSVMVFNWFITSILLFISQSLVNVLFISVTSLFLITLFFLRPFLIARDNLLASYFITFIRGSYLPLGAICSLIIFGDIFNIVFVSFVLLGISASIIILLTRLDGASIKKFLSIERDLFP